MTNTRLAFAWILFLGGLTGAILSVFKVIAPEEPQLILQLSWGAVWIEGFNSIQLAADHKKKS